MNTLSGDELAQPACKAPDDERAPTTRAGRLAEVDHAKGFAIALVVWGHVAGSTIPLAPTWFFISVAVIYSFHMPFFMYLSGYVFFAIAAHKRFLDRPSTYTAQRFKRLMIPFVGFAVIVVLGKYLIARFGPVDDQVTSLGTGFYDVISNSPDNPCLAVWYLLCLFVYCVLSPLLWRAGRHSVGLIVLVGCAGWLFYLPEAFYVARLAHYFIFFAVGGIVGVHRHLILPLIKKTTAVSFALFLAACYFMLGNRYAVLVCGLVAIPALHGLFLQSFAYRDRLFLMFGNYSLTIYLFNTIVLGAFKFFYLRYFNYAGASFYAFLAEALALGLFTPILLLNLIKFVPGSTHLTRFLR